MDPPIDRRHQQTIKGNSGDAARRRKTKRLLLIAYALFVVLVFEAIIERLRLPTTIKHALLGIKDESGGTGASTVASSVSDACPSALAAKDAEIVRLREETKALSSKLVAKDAEIDRLRSAGGPVSKKGPSAANHINSHHEANLDTRVTSHGGSNKTLLIVMGNLRGGEEAWESLFTNVLDPSSADLALMIGETPAASRTSSLFSRAKYTWFFQEYEDWGDAIDLINGTKWRKTHLPTIQRSLKESGLLGGVKPLRGSGAIILMIRWFLSNRIKEHNLDKKYERFVITRSDHYYMCTHNVTKFDNNFLWIPPGSDCRGYTDRHLIASREHVLEALDILPAFFRGPQEANVSNPESLIKAIWDRKGLKVRYCPRVMFTCAVSTDTTRWQKHSEPVPGVPGLFKKYVEEYDGAIDTCINEFPSNLHTVLKGERKYFDQDSLTMKETRYQLNMCNANQGIKSFPPGCNWTCYFHRNPKLLNHFNRTEEAAVSHYAKHGISEGRNCSCDRRY